MEKQEILAGVKHVKLYSDLLQASKTECLIVLDSQQKVPQFLCHSVLLQMIKKNQFELLSMLSYHAGDRGRE